MSDPDPPLAAPPVTLEDYRRGVGELRAAARDARARIERADVVIAGAFEFARDRRRRAVKAAAKQHRVP